IEVADTADIPKTGKKIQASLIAVEVKTVVAEHEKLSRIIFPDFNVAMLHGKMKAKDKDRIMGDFRDHKTDVLVSTSVIEVGVDVPNATVMMIEGAERFGLAQLHQFRGRVGRGSGQSYCFLFPSERGMAGSRLNALTATVSGFELAEIDLKLRGPGEFLGTKQSGISSLGMAALTKPHLVRDVRKAAKDILHKDPDLHAHRLIREKVTAMRQMVHDE
ncbi:MAG: helicase-related protein, partial [Patescibacteria group bacterium]